MNIRDENIQQLIRQALDEDIGSGDITSQLTIGESSRSLGVLMSKQDGVLAGIEIVRAVLLAVDPSAAIEVLKQDGATVGIAEIVLTVQGNTRSLLAAERTALNFVQHLSGIATETARYVGAIKGTRAKILDTRKTLPGWRQLEKYAVTCGGGTNHRMGLYDLVLIKDNHIEAAGGVAPSIRQVREQKPDVPIEVEVQNLTQLDEAIALAPDIIMLDNMNTEMMQECCRRAWSNPARDTGKLKLEASGNVSIENVRRIAETGVDYISVGAITHSAPALDFSLKVRTIG